VGGSDTHTIAGVGRTFTEVRSARNVEEFFSGLRASKGEVHGEHGSYVKLTADVFHIVWSLWMEKPWTLALMPLSLLVPAFTAGHWVNEIRFCRAWSAALESGEKRQRMIWILASRRTGARWANNHGCHTHCLGLH
jgi:hypothetical protein